MNTLVLLSLEAVTLAVTVLLTQLTALVFRGPYRNAWLRSEAVQTLVVVTLMAAGSFSFGYLVSDLVAAGLHVFTAIGITAAFPFLVALASNRIFRFRERLRLAEAGMSPFHSLALKRATRLATPHT